MLSISVTEFNKHLPLYLDKAMRGETIVVRRNRKEIARLVPPSPAMRDRPPTAEAKPRIPGLGRGSIKMREDFDEPLPDSFWLGES